jgi:hypothetical protein
VPTRIIKEAIVTSEALAELTADEECLFWRIAVCCDYCNQLTADPVAIQARCFNQKKRELCTPKFIADSLDSLEGAGLIKRISCGASAVLELTKESEELITLRDAWDRRTWLETSRRIFRRDKWTCVYCSSGDDLTVDHVVPRSRGGSNDDSNLATACRACNSRKNARTPEEAGLVRRFG